MRIIYSMSLTFATMMEQLTSAGATEVGARAFLYACQDVERTPASRNEVYTQWARCFRHNNPRCTRRSKLVWPPIVLQWLRLCTFVEDEDNQEQSRSAVIVPLADFVQYIIPK